MTPHASDEPKAGIPKRLGRFLWHEFRLVLPPTVYFIIGFNLILFTKRLILADDTIQFDGFFVATMAALIVGKTVLVADKLPFLRRFDYAPLAQPILFKTVVYTLLVSVVRLPRLTDARRIDVLRDPTSAPHHELVAILRSLAHAEHAG